MDKMMSDVHFKIQGRGDEVGGVIDEVRSLKIAEVG